MVLPESFVRFQKTKAEAFGLEFCIPTFMLLDLSLPQSRSDAIRYVSDTFTVTTPFAEKRLERIERRMINNHLLDQASAAIEAKGF